MDLCYIDGGFDNTSKRDAAAARAGKCKGNESDSRNSLSGSSVPQGSLSVCLPLQTSFVGSGQSVVYEQVLKYLLIRVY